MAARTPSSCASPRRSFPAAASGARRASSAALGAYANPDAASICPALGGACCARAGVRAERRLGVTSCARRETPSLLSQAGRGDSHSISNGPADDAAAVDLKPRNMHIAKAPAQWERACRSAGWTPDERCSSSVHLNYARTLHFNGARRLRHSRQELARVICIQQYLP